MTRLTNWTAKRAGGRITIYATGPDGKPVTITGIDTIKGGKPGGLLSRGSGPVATRMTGETYELA